MLPNQIPQKWWPKLKASDWSYCWAMEGRLCWLANHARQPWTDKTDMSFCKLIDGHTQHTKGLVRLSQYVLMTLPPNVIMPRTRAMTGLSRFRNVTVHGKLIIKWIESLLQHIIKQHAFWSLFDHQELEHSSPDKSFGLSSLLDGDDLLKHRTNSVKEQ